MRGDLTRLSGPSRLAIEQADYEEWEAEQAAIIAEDEELEKAEGLTPQEQSRLDEEAEDESRDNAAEQDWIRNGRVG